MKPNQGNISVTKTARYFVIGEDNQSVNQVLFVLHGYGMQAAEFIKQFSSLVQPGTIVVAPEGLSRFYRKGFAGEVVASWMTREDRQLEISDYIGYLDRLYDHFITKTEVKVYVLGFSQGASTASRWVMTGNRKVNGLIIWSGEFAPDNPSFNSGLDKIWQVLGFSDEFISVDRFLSQSQYLESKGFKVYNEMFDGGHVIDQLTLRKVWDDLQKQH